MGRVRLGVSTAVILALAGPAGAAELTRLQSAEPGDPFALEFSLRWNREQEKANITRETASGTAFPAVIDQDELRYARVRNDLVTRFALALYQDLELHVDIPYSMGDDATWSLATPLTSTLTSNDRDAMGGACPDSNADGLPGPCPLFEARTSDTTVFKGGELGDLQVGIAWGIFNDRRDDTKPTWVVALDATFPTAKLYEPGKGRSADMRSPYFTGARRGPAGEKVWKWDLSTSLSRRFGPVDPYFKAHVTGMTKSAKTYSNCDYVEELAATGDATLASVAACASPRWKDQAGAKLPWIAGLTFGAELVPFEDTREDQKVTFDFRLFGDYTSRARFYNELTDASGKLHMTDAYLTMGGYVGLYLRASRWVTLDVSGSLATRTSHYLTGETPGTGDLDDPGATGVNPNYDWRYDAPGNRFRVADVMLFSLSGSFILSF